MTAVGGMTPAAERVAAAAAGVSAPTAVLREGEAAVQTQCRDGYESDGGTKTGSILHNITNS